MNRPPPPEASGPAWYTRPSVLLSAVAVLVIVSALLAPDTANGRSGDSRLTTFSTGPQGARLFYELANRLGWKADRRITPAVPDDPATIQAVLAPVEPLTMAEVHALLQAVRQGGALLLVLPSGQGPLNDSLHLTLGVGADFQPPDSLMTDSCAGNSGVTLPLWPAGHVLLYSLRWTGPPPGPPVTFARVSATGPRAFDRPAVVGFPFGRGRIVVASDPDVLRNDALRVCRYGLSVIAVRTLEYLRGGGDTPRTRILFDEYHQGNGAQPGTVSAIVAFFGRTAAGHLLLQLLGAGLVVLLAAAPRVLPPRGVTQARRRSPIEHVDALARAYAQVGATRTAVTRLVRGVRRRIGLAAARATAGRSDDEFLDWVARTTPHAAAETDRVRHALAAPVSRREFAAVGDALAHIESSLTRLSP